MITKNKLLGILLVILLALIAADIIVSNVLRIRIADGGDPAARTLRTIVSANQTYYSTYGNGFARTLSQLGGFPTVKASCDHAALIDNELASGRKYGYLFSYRSKLSIDLPAKGCTEAGATAFSVNADPMTPSSENQHLFVDETGVLRIEKDRPAAATSTPVQ